jgi:hypothetical protein
VGQISRIREAEVFGYQLGKRGYPTLTKEHFEELHGHLLARTGSDGKTRNGGTEREVRSAFERGHRAGFSEFGAFDQEVRAKRAARAPDPTKKCDRCEEELAEIRISAATLGGELLDLDEVCRGCARDAGFEIGGPK